MARLTRARSAFLARMTFGQFEIGYVLKRHPALVNSADYAYFGKLVLSWKVQCRVLDALAKQSRSLVLNQGQPTEECYVWIR